MPRTKVSLFYTLLIFLSTAMMSCGRAVIKPESPLDNPQTSYDQGKRFLVEGKIPEAMNHFERSIGLSNDFAPGYEGLGNCYLALGKNKEARRYLNKAISRSSDWLPAHIGLGKAYREVRQYNNAIKEFEFVLKKDRQNSEAYVELGITYRSKGEGEEARKNFLKALETDNTNMRAARELEKLTELATAATGQPPEYLKIANSPAVSRAEMAAILVVELPLKSIFDQKEIPLSTEAIKDVDENYWAYRYIREVLGYGITGLELLPNGEFQPDRHITKLTLALIIQELIVGIDGDESLRTQYIHNKPLFSDIPPGHYAHNAVLLATSRNYMQGKGDGSFGLMEEVSGTEVLNIMRKLKALVK